MSELRGALGLLVILAVAFLAFLASNHRARIPWRTVAVGLAAQIAFAVLVLRWSAGKDVLDVVSGQVVALIGYTKAGITFLSGKLVADKKETIFALQVLPVIIFIGALVGAISRAMHTTKVESLYAATVIFLDQSEAPLMIQSCWGSRRCWRVRSSTSPTRPSRASSRPRCDAATPQRRWIALEKA
ncbi:MAG: Na+ dependent nucleoside transporter N-terminal domain-containing protein [Solirubrobacteraceae bacterium]